MNLELLATFLAGLLVSLLIIANTRALRQDIAASDARLRDDIKEVENRLREEIRHVEARLNQDISDLRNRMTGLELGQARLEGLLGRPGASSPATKASS